MEPASHVVTVVYVSFTALPCEPLTTPRRCSSQRLEISNTLEELWYKDEGGRDKCLALNVRLVGPDGQPVHRRVGLRVRAHSVCPCDGAYVGAIACAQCVSLRLGICARLSSQDRACAPR